MYYKLNRYAPTIKAVFFPLLQHIPLDARHLERGEGHTSNFPPVIAIPRNHHGVLDIITSGLFPALSVPHPKQFAGGGIQFRTLRNGEGDTLAGGEAVGGVEYEHGRLWLEGLQSSRVAVVCQMGLTASHRRIEGRLHACHA